jgi:hypothetical protein
MPLSLVSTLPLALLPVLVGAICANATVATVMAAIASINDLRIFPSLITSSTGAATSG